jgi:protein-S-isoprenylcysteine O-methyltransferase Ste14
VITESLFRLAFWVIFGAMFLMQMCFSARQRNAVDIAADEAKLATRREPAFAVVRVVRSISMVAFLVLYALDSPWLGPLALPFPDWLRWLGGVLGAASLALYAWSRATLGRQWSSQLRVRQEHQLVTTGPYARIRHPIYSALTLFLTSIALVTANAFLFAFLAVSLLDHALRIPKEERMMIDRFGEQYKAYMRRTGRLLPK